MKHKANAWHLSLWGILMIRALLVGNPTWAQGPTQSAPTASICVAVIEPEVSADLPPAERKALAGSLDTLLTESLAKQSGFVLVDRQALDKVLAEKALEVGGAAKIAATDVAEPLRPFWTAGVLVCSGLGPADPKKPAAGPVLISLEAVAAQTGQLLAEVHFTAKRESSGGAVPQLPGALLEQFWQTVERNASRAKGLPLVEVPETQLVSSMPRLQWMADDLADTLRAVVVASRRAILLTPRHPGSTKEERLLRVMGLAVAKPNDSVASLAPAPDVRVAAEVKEEQATDISFGKTPVQIRLQWQGRGAKPVPHELKGTVGQYEDLRKQAVFWFQSRLAEGVGEENPPADEEQRAHEQAVMPTEPLSTYFLMAKPSHQAAYEQVITDTIAANGRLTLIDRTQLARALEEHKLEIQGSQKAPLRAIIAADVFVFSYVTTEGSRAYLQVNAIHGPTASLLDELKLPIDPAERLRPHVAGQAIPILASQP